MIQAYFSFPFSSTHVTQHTHAQTRSNPVQTPPHLHTSTLTRTHMRLETFVNTVRSKHRHIHMHMPRCTITRAAVVDASDLVKLSTSNRSCNTRQAPVHFQPEL